MLHFSGNTGPRGCNMNSACLFAGEFIHRMEKNSPGWQQHRYSFFPLPCPALPWLASFFFAFPFIFFFFFSWSGKHITPACVSEQGVWLLPFMSQQDRASLRQDHFPTLSKHHCLWACPSSPFTHFVLTEKSSPSEAAPSPCSYSPLWAEAAFPLLPHLQMTHPISFILLKWFPRGHLLFHAWNDIEN